MSVSMYDCLPTLISLAGTDPTMFDSGVVVATPLITLTY